MSKNTQPLEEAFANALARAATFEQDGIGPNDVRECVDYYRQHQAVIDAAVQSALNFLESPDGRARAKALGASFDGQEPDPLSSRLATEIIDSDEFSSLTSFANFEVQGLGLGASGGVSLLVGGLAGIDFVFQFEGKSTGHPRAWYGYSIKSGISIDLAFELSVWFNKPLTTELEGVLFDLYIRTQATVLVFLRFMFIKQKGDDGHFHFSGVSLQFPFGVGFPIRMARTGLPAIPVLSSFKATQKVFAVSRRATLEVINKATKTSTIAVKETASLSVSLKNNSGNDFNLSPQATMTIKMPAFFTVDDVDKMKVDSDEWGFSIADGELNLTLLVPYPWQNGSAISFDISDVASSAEPPLNETSVEGSVRAVLQDASFTGPMINDAKFSLVWGNYKASLKWKVTLTGDFTLNGDSGGTTEEFAEPGQEVRPLTTATNKTGDLWTLGFRFNYNEGSENVVPQVQAVWKEQGGRTTYAGNLVATSGKTSIAFYLGLEESGSSIAITPTFDSST